MNNPTDNLCAADLREPCMQLRADGSIFCQQHKRAANRTYYAARPITSDQLAYMMQRDGKQQ